MCGCDLLWGILSLDTCRHHVGMVRFQADSLARWDGCLFWVRGGDVNPSCVDVCFRTTGSAFFCSAPSRFSCGARFVERRWGVRHDPAEGQSQHPKSMHGRSLVLPGVLLSWVATLQGLRRNHIACTEACAACRRKSPGANASRIRPRTLGCKRSIQQMVVVASFPSDRGGGDCREVAKLMPKVSFSQICKICATATLENSSLFLRGLLPKVFIGIWNGQGRSGDVSGLAEICSREKHMYI
jgi:hypothetical protein